MFIANRRRLHDIACLGVNSQLVHGYGTFVYGKDGEKNESYEVVCQELYDTVNSSLSFLLNLERDLSSKGYHIYKVPSVEPSPSSVSLE